MTSRFQAMVTWLRRARAAFGAEVNGLLQGKKSYRKMPRAEIVIFDAEGAPTVMECLPDASTFVLHVRGEAVHLNLKTLVLRALYTVKYRRPRFAYYLAVLAQLKPRVVLTFIDNSLGFHQLSNYLENVAFIAIQNGWRFPDVPNPLGSQGHFKSTMLCFGDNEIVNWPKRGVLFQRVVSVGSLKASLVESKFGDDVGKFQHSSVPETSILYLSQFREGSERFKTSGAAIITLADELRCFEEFNSPLDSGEFWQTIGIPAHILNERLNLEWLVNALEELNESDGISPPSLAIARAKTWEQGSQKSDVEFDYFRRIIPSSKFKLLPKSGPLDNYLGLQEFNVIVSSGSTLAQESLGLRKKVLVSQPIASPLQAPDFSLPWWLINHSYEDFKKALLKILSEANQTFVQEYSEAISYYSGQPTNQPTHELIRAEIEKTLKLQT